MATKKSAPKKKKASTPRPVKKGPRQQTLAGMEDNRISVLEEKALEYAEVRDQRIGLSQQEGTLKGELLDLMKAQKRQRYQHGSIVIEIIHEKEKIKVKVKAGSSDDDDEEEGGEDSEDDEGDNEKSTVVTESRTPLSTEAGRTGKITIIPPAAKSGPKQLAEYHKQHPN